MKVLHTLVGYLAVTALQPFHSFALASQATIDYDGYVNTSTQNHIDDALMEHALGSIMETCQTITRHSGYVNATQIHGDSAAMKRVPGDLIEARQAEADLTVPEFAIVVALVTLVVTSILWIANDDPVRDNDVESLVVHFFD